MSERPTAPNIVPFAWVARVISYELHSKDCRCYVPFATEQGRLGLDRDLSTLKGGVRKWTKPLKAGT